MGFKILFLIGGFPLERSYTVIEKSSMFGEVIVIERFLVIFSPYLLLFTFSDY